MAILTRRVTTPLVAAAIATGTLIAASSPSRAFWERSQIAACAEARSEAEWLWRQCWIFEPVPEFPVPALYPYGESYSPSYSGSYRHRPGGRPVVRRLG
jgi:hypothetical protein